MLIELVTVTVTITHTSRRNLVYVAPMRFTSSFLYSPAVTFLGIRQPARQSVVLSTTRVDWADKVAGCDIIVSLQGTVNGIGERTGNANLMSIIPTLQLKMGMEGVGEHLSNLTALSRFTSEQVNTAQRS